MQHVPRNYAEGHEGQITKNAIELQVHFGLPMALSCLLSIR